MKDSNSTLKSITVRSLFFGSAILTILTSDAFVIQPNLKQPSHHLLYNNNNNINKDVLSLKMSSSDSNEKEEEEEKNIAGSFFNAVPEPKKSNSSDDEVTQNEIKASESQTQLPDINADPFDQSIANLIQQRSSKPLAAAESTLGGIPTSKATGFGKNTGKGGKGKNKKSYVEIGKNGPSIANQRIVNDPTKPEYDDQGFTLYTNEETGEKGRVFESLVEYPCNFKIKIVGANEGAFVSEMVALVAENCNVEAESISFKERKKGKWTSVTVSAPVQSAEMLYALYEVIDRDPRVKFKF